MFQVDRLNRIKEIINYHRSVDVSELSNVLNVSEVTIRRDLEKLEQEGYLKRVYGGATIVQEPVLPATIRQEETYIGLPSFDQIGESSRIVGEMAARMVEDFDVIFIGPSHSGLALARNIKNKNGVVVMTNYLPICLELFQSQARIVMIGGELDTRDSTFKNTHIDYDICMLPVEKAFIPFRGFDLDAGYAFNDREELLVCEHLKKNAKFLIGMIEGNLFDKRGFVTMPDDNAIHAIVSDKGIPDKYRSFYFEKNVDLYEGIRLE